MHLALGKQAKVLSKYQIDSILNLLEKKRNGLRDCVIFLLSTKAGLRAKEISNLQWKMLLGSDGQMSDYISLTDLASKGNSGRKIPLNEILKSKLLNLMKKATTTEYQF